MLAQSALIVFLHCKVCWSPAKVQLWLLLIVPMNRKYVKVCDFTRGLMLLPGERQHLQPAGAFVSIQTQCREIWCLSGENESTRKKKRKEKRGMMLGVNVMHLRLQSDLTCNKVHVLQLLLCVCELPPTWSQTRLWPTGCGGGGSGGGGSSGCAQGCCPVIGLGSQSAGSVQPLSEHCVILARLFKKKKKHSYPGCCPSPPPPPHTPVPLLSAESRTDEGSGQASN